MQRIIEIIDSCDTFVKLKTFYDTFLMKAVMDEEQALITRGAYMLKLHQFQAKGKAEWKPERFPVTDEQPVKLNVID